MQRRRSCQAPAVVGHAGGPPTNWETSSGNVRLESAWLGGRLRRLGYVAGTEVVTRRPPPKTSWLYWLLYERGDYGWDIERISPDDNLLRIRSLKNHDTCLGTWEEHAHVRTFAANQSCDRPGDVDGARHGAWTFPGGDATRAPPGGHRTGWGLSWAGRP